MDIEERFWNSRPTWKQVQFFKALIKKAAEKNIVMTPPAWQIPKCYEGALYPQPAEWTDRNFEELEQSAVAQSPQYVWIKRRKLSIMIDALLTALNGAQTKEV